MSWLFVGLILTLVSEFGIISIALLVVIYSKSTQTLIVSTLRDNNNSWFVKSLDLKIKNRNKSSRIIKVCFLHFKIRDFYHKSENITLILNMYLYVVNFKYEKVQVCYYKLIEKVKDLVIKACKLVLLYTPMHILD